jgi:CheY-like chemotaxis protein
MAKFNRVMVIDDDDIFNFIATKTIERNGYSDNVVTALNGQEGIEFLESAIDSADDSNLPDLILLDINMPILNGWSFLESFRSLRSQIKKKIRLAIVSTSVDPDDRLRASQFPEVNRFISKPLKTSDLDLLASA